MSLDSFVKKSKEVCSDLARLELISTGEKRGIFSLYTKDGVTKLVIPANIETFSDSMMLQLAVSLCSDMGYGVTATNEQIDPEHLVDCYWQPALSYFTGIARGILGLKENKPLLDNPSKTPYSEGVWYVQSRKLRKTGMPELALQIPKAMGLFSYTSQKSKGLTLVESTNLATIINAAIDSAPMCNQLIQKCVLTPEVLKTRQVIKHKTPSAKKMMYWPGEIRYLNRVVTPELIKLEEELKNSYKRVIDIKSYREYLDAIELYNKKYGIITKAADLVASDRYPLLFAKGLKGDQHNRLDTFSLDQMNKMCPNDLDRAPRPYLPSLDNKGIKEYIGNIEICFNQMKDVDLKTAFNEWKGHIMQNPLITRYVRNISLDHDDI